MARNGVLDHLRAGAHCVEVGCTELGWLEFDAQLRTSVDGENTTDVGIVELPQCGDVEIVGPAAEFAIEVYRRRADCDVRVERLTSAPDSRTRLPAGSYVALWRRANGTVAGTAFDVRAGGRTTVECATAPVRSRK